MKNIISLFMLLPLLLGVAHAHAKSNTKIKISYTPGSEVIEYGVSMFEKDIKPNGGRLEKNVLSNNSDKGIIILTEKDTSNANGKIKPYLIRTLDALEDDGFEIRKEKGSVLLICKNDRGCLYAIFELSEQLGNSTDIANSKNKIINPSVSFRTVKFNLPWSPYRAGPANDVHIETVRDLEFWEAYLDMLARNRFNALTLWNNHPFPYMIRAKNYPKATPFDEAELLEWQTFFKTIFKMAKERGLERYLINWNIVVSPEFAEHYDAKEYFDRSELVKKYTRESVTQLINEYDDLTGFGITLADWMGNWGEETMTPQEREDWIQETVVQGIKDADRPIKFVHRAVLSGKPELMRKVIDYADLPEKTNVEIKFNWSHGHSTPKLSLTHANDDGTVMKGFWDPRPENYFLSWMVRNEDFFVLRWGDPSFIKQHILTNDFDYVDGYWVGSEGYIPAKDYSHITPHPHKTWSYAFEKQWLFYHLWGRLIYNPKLDIETLNLEVSRRHKGIDAASYMEASSLASEVPLHLASFYKGTWDLTLYSEGFIAPYQPKREDGKSPFISLQEFMQHETLDSRYLSIPDYMRYLKSDNKDPNLITPVQLAQTLKANSKTALELIKKLEKENDSPTLQSELDDLKTWCQLGYYFAAKLEASVALSLYTESKNLKHKKQALGYGEDALKYWKKVIKLTENRYQVMPYVLMTHPENTWLDFNGFHWKHYLKDVEYDIEYIKNQ